MVAVIRAFKTDYFPLGGTVSEEVLELEDGRAVYLNPTEEDRVCNSLDTALDICFGSPQESDSLKASWAEGY